MPLAAKPVDFTWSLPSINCNHGRTPNGADFTDEFFQKVKETKTTLDRIYLSSLLRNRTTDTAAVYDYEKWARKGGKVPAVGVATKLSSALQQQQRAKHPRKVVRPLGLDNDKIEAALRYGVMDDTKKERTTRVPRLMARVQCYDLIEEYAHELDKIARENADYSLDSAKVFRVMQEETRDQANRRLTRGKCGSVVRKRQMQGTCQEESEDEVTTDQHSDKDGNVFTEKQKIDFSDIKKRGVIESNTISYRLPKLISTPIKDTVVTTSEDVVKLPRLDAGRTTHHYGLKVKRGKRCKKATRNRQRKSGEKRGEKSKSEEQAMLLNTNQDELETQMQVLSSNLDEVSEKLSDMTGRDIFEGKKKRGKPKLHCKKVVDEEELINFPFRNLGLDSDSDSDEECLCDECLEELTSLAQPSKPKPPKSILSPRRRRNSSSRGNKVVSFAEMGSLEDVRLITPLAMRNENVKKFEEEERKERREARDMKRRQRKRIERERFNKTRAGKNDDESQTEDASQKSKANSDSAKDRSTVTMVTVEIVESEEVDSGIESQLSSPGPEPSTTTPAVLSDDSHESETSPRKVEPDRELAIPTDDALCGTSSELHEVPALMLDPQIHGRLYEENVLEKADGSKITVAQLGYRIKNIFNRQPPPPKDRLSPNEAEPSPNRPDMPEVTNSDSDDLPNSDGDFGDTDDPFVTKCVVWNETTDSANTSRSATPITPVEKEDMSDFIMSMKDCRYIRWSRSYVDMLVKMDKL